TGVQTCALPISAEKSWDTRTTSAPVAQRYGTLDKSHYRWPQEHLAVTTHPPDRRIQVERSPRPTPRPEMTPREHFSMCDAHPRSRGTGREGPEVRATARRRAPRIPTLRHR